MVLRRYWPVAFACLALSGCGREQPRPPVVRLAPPESPKPAAAAPVTPRPGRQRPEPEAVKAPALRPGAALRPRLISATWQKDVDGTGFIVRDRNHRRYLVTPAGVLNAREWQAVRSVRLTRLDGFPGGLSIGPSLFIGTPVGAQRPGSDGLPDPARDLVVRRMSGADGPPGLPLAHADPELEDVVWVVGSERHGRAGEKLYRAEVVDVREEGQYEVRMVEQIGHQALSGAPAVNAQGEVVGNVVSWHGDRLRGATAAAIRQRLSEVEVPVD